MVIRYKYYDDWRHMETWEMSHFFKPNWWDMYITSVVMMILGGMLLGIDTGLVLSEAFKW